MITICNCGVGLITGTIKSWKTEGAYGFIKPDDPTYADIFLHITQLHKANIKTIPKPGDRFGFEEGEGKNGKCQAINLVTLA